VNGVTTCTEGSSAASQDVLISAVDRDAETADSNAMFFARLLFGIAGPALIGALQELLHVHPQLAGADRSPEGEELDDYAEYADASRAYESVL